MTFTGDSTDFFLSIQKAWVYSNYWICSNVSCFRVLVWFGTIRFSVKLFPPAPCVYLCHKVFKTPFEIFAKKHFVLYWSLYLLLLGLLPKCLYWDWRNQNNFSSFILVSLYQLILFKLLVWKIKCTLNLKRLPRFHNFFLAEILNTKVMYQTR